MKKVINLNLDKYWVAWRRYIHSKIHFPIEKNPSVWMEKTKYPIQEQKEVQFKWLFLCKRRNKFFFPLRTCTKLYTTQVSFLFYKSRFIFWRKSFSPSSEQTRFFKLSFTLCTTKKPIVATKISLAIHTKIKKQMHKKFQDDLPCTFSNTFFEWSDQKKLLSEL